MPGMKETVARLQRALLKDEPVLIRKPNNRLPGVERPGESFQLRLAALIEVAGCGDGTGMTAYGSSNFVFCALFLVF